MHQSGEVVHVAAAQIGVRACLEGKALVVLMVNLHATPAHTVPVTALSTESEEAQRHQREIGGAAETGHDVPGR